MKHAIVCGTLLGCGLTALYGYPLLCWVGRFLGVRLWLRRP